MIEWFDLRQLCPWCQRQPSAGLYLLSTYWGHGGGRPLLGHICLYAYMHKVNPNIFQYFLWFYSCITFISLFAHHSNFFWISPYFCCCSIHLKKPVISTWHSYLLPFRCLHSHMSCKIKLYNTGCVHPFRCQISCVSNRTKTKGWLWNHRLGYMWAQTCTCTFLLSE